MDDEKLNQRIKKKAYDLWEQEGRPDGRASEHWEKARILIAIEDDRTSLVPVAPEHPEEASIQENLGEFPGAFTDQGDRQPFPAAQSRTEAATPPAPSKRKQRAKS